MSSGEGKRNGTSVEALEMLLHALAHQIESQAYLQMAVRIVDDPGLKASLIEILGQEQLHETKLRAKLREKFSLEL